MPVDPPLRKGTTHRVVVELKGPMNQERVGKFHQELAELLKKYRGKVTEKRRQRGADGF